MFVVWSFKGEQAQLQGIFDNEKTAQDSCEIGDCYHYIHRNRVYKNEIDTSAISLYKCADGKFRCYQKAIEFMTKDYPKCFQT